MALDPRNIAESPENACEKMNYLLMSLKWLYADQCDEALREFKKLVDDLTNDLTNLYHTYIHPYLIYCIEIWGIAPKCHLNHILLIQKKIVRIIRYTHYFAHTEIIFKELGILPIENIFIERVGGFYVQI